LERAAPITLKIRGIYCTALTKFFLDRGLSVCEPSPVILSRFREIPPSAFYGTADVEILDMENLQGVRATGPEGMVEAVIHLLREPLFDAVCRRREAREGVCVEIEFPACAKSALDEIRNQVLHTLIHHHRLRIIASEALDLLEQRELAARPSERETLSRTLERRLIWDALAPGKTIAIEHVKLDGRVIHLSEGEIVALDDQKRELVLRRSKFKGRFKYDGLDLPKQEGDYALTRVREGAWCYHHTYYRASDAPLGAYYNINTPVEFYPDRIRYVDLEIDVITWPGGRVEVIDQEKLESRHQSGHLTDALRDLARTTAAGLKDAVLEGISSPGGHIPSCPISP
jgi:hypothetical protein